MLVTLEENVLSGGCGEKVLDLFNKKTHAISYGDLKIINVSIPDKYVEHGNPDILKKEIGIDANSVAERIERLLSEIS